MEDYVRLCGINDTKHIYGLNVTAITIDRDERLEIPHASAIQNPAHRQARNPAPGSICGSIRQPRQHSNPRTPPSRSPEPASFIHAARQNKAQNRTRKPFKPPIDFCMNPRWDPDPGPRKTWRTRSFKATQTALPQMPLKFSTIQQWVTFCPIVGNPRAFVRKLLTWGVMRC